MSDESVFAEAVAIPDPVERAAYLDRACAGNPDLRREVEELLAAHTAAGDFLAGPAEAVPTARYVEPDRVGGRVGPYKLLQKIGEGGMGVVYMADQEEPVKRRVALKVIQPGADSRTVLARFEAERQALALMDHPNIARVLDAGTTTDGRPYFVMELVKGVPITKFCDDNKLTPRQRLELFVPVCQAIQHAHQKGVIHRDVKPSNVLVTLYDGKPVPKVIDFGIAKATAQKLTERTLFTEFGALIGTPEYMAPEQAELNALDIDTRADVYALGVMLYELLTGTTPLDRKRVREAGYGEMLRLIREVEPERPSARLTARREALASVSAQRHTEPAKLMSLVRGELDWIVMKALEKDRGRRYETANGLARDVERYLAGDPVEACPPTVGYRLRKVYRKNRAAVLTAAAFGAVLLAGATSATWQAVRATRAETEARRAGDQATTDRDRARDAEQRAVAEKTNAQAALRFLLAEVLEQADPNQEPDRDLTLRTVLDRAADRLKRDEGMPPLVEAAIRLTMGRIYRWLGEFEKAEFQLTQAYALQQRHDGEDHPNTLDAASDLAQLYHLQSDLSKAEPLTARVLDARRRLLGDDHPDTLLAAAALGMVYWSRDENDRAEQLVAPALQASRRLHGDRDPLTFELMRRLGAIYTELERFEEAEALLDESLKGLRASGLREDNPGILIVRSHLARFYLRSGRFAEAERELREAYEKRRAVLGEQNFATVGLRGALAQVYLAQGRRTDAAPYLREFREYAERQKDRLPSFLIRDLHELGLALLRDREFAGAESFLRLYLDIATKKKLGSWRLPDAQAALGACLLGQKKYAEAEPMLDAGYKGLKVREKDTPQQGVHNLPQAGWALVLLYERTGRPEKAAAVRAELGAETLPRPRAVVR